MPVASYFSPPVSFSILSGDVTGSERGQTESLSYGYNTNSSQFTSSSASNSSPSASILYTKSNRVVGKAASPHNHPIFYNNICVHQQHLSDHNRPKLIFVINLEFIKTVTTMVTGLPSSPHSLE
ncbi:hypothetical protein ACE6H2_014485 [Prunus campanulata]